MKLDPNEKRCPHCKQVYLRVEFGFDKNRQTKAYCRKCMTEIDRVRNAKYNAEKQHLAEFDG